MTFCLQIQRQVSARRVDARVSQPVGNGAEIDSRSEQVNRRAVPHAVRMQSLTLEGRHTCRCLANVLLEDKTHAKAAQRLSAMIAENALLVVPSNPTLFQVQAQRTGRLRPQRTTSLFATLSSEANTRRRIQEKIAGLQADDFPYSGTGVEHEIQENMVTATGSSGAVNAAEDRLDLGQFQMFDFP